MTAREVVVAMLAAKGVKDAKPEDVRGLATTVQTCLSHHDGGTVRNVATGIPGRWVLNP
jgi:hypothetical protein